VQLIEANEQMVDRLIAEGALWSRLLIAAFRATPRQCFIDRVFQYQRKDDRWREILTRDPGPEELRLVYSDQALITHVRKVGRHGAAVPVSSSSQPSLMAQMLEDLKLVSGLHVLEIGAGTGYNGALLAHVVGPDQVTSLDVDREVLSEAWAHLRAFAARQVKLQHADGRAGFAERAPYDRIMVTAATADLEPAWLEQLAEGGLLLAPLALAPGLAFVVRGTVEKGIFHGRLLRPAYFMPLRAEDETGTENEDRPPACGELRPWPAPWADWFDRRRPRTSWLGLIQALVFYGLLRGLTIHYQTLANGETAYGVEESGSHCWLGAKRWQASDERGRRLGWELWRAFLEAGGPRPMEFRLQASTAKGLSADGPEVYLRRSLRCWQRWEFQTPIERTVWF
jgi:protein-L-isoaspartate(D-aspartate) O-methyltransferase